MLRDLLEETESEMGPFNKGFFLPPTGVHSFG